MGSTPINEVLAENLKFFMGQKGYVQASLASKCGVAQTTVSNYLNPHRRQAGASGKPPSAKLSEVEMLASALEVEPWQLLRSFTTTERQAYDNIEAAYRALTAATPSALTSTASERSQTPSSPSRKTA